MANENSRKLNIDEWRELAKAGANINVKIEPTGVSMRPLIRGGRDMVIVEPMHREPVPGDIVLFLRADGAQVMHRVWKITGETVTTYGDGCWYPDEPINKEKIIGLATKLYRRKASKERKKVTEAKVKNDPINKEDDIINKTSISQNGCKKSGFKKEIDKGRSINLDTKFRRKTGLLWLNIAPVRRAYYRVRNLAHSIKRRIIT